MNRRFDGLGAAGSVGVLLALIALWWAASHGGWVSRVFLPSPEATLDSLLAGLGAGGELLAFTGATVGRMLLGWGLASLLGVALGALIGSSAAARVWIAPCSAGAWSATRSFPANAACAAGGATPISARTAKSSACTAPVRSPSAWSCPPVCSYPGPTSCPRPPPASPNRSATVSTWSISRGTFPPRPPW